MLVLQSANAQELVSGQNRISNKHKPAIGTLENPVVGGPGNSLVSYSDMQ